MSTLKVNEIRHLSNTGTRNIELETNGTTNLQATSTLGLTVTGTLDVSGLSTFTGNVVLGNATTDTVDLQSKVTGFNNFSGFTGEVRMYAGNEGPNAPPSGWLYCNGDTISETTGHGGRHYNADGKGNDYELLFNLLKTNNNWGNSGSPTWGHSSTGIVKLPDFRSRSPVGVHTGAENALPTGLTARAISVGTSIADGSTLVGKETHALVVAELALHSHVMTNPLVSTGVVAKQDSHTHTSDEHHHAQTIHYHPQTVHDHPQTIHDHSTPAHAHPIPHTHNMPHNHSMPHTHNIATTETSTTSIPVSTVQSEYIYGRSGVTAGKIAVGGDWVGTAYGKAPMESHTHYFNVPAHATQATNTTTTSGTNTTTTSGVNTTNSSNNTSPANTGDSGAVDTGNSAVVNTGNSAAVNTALTTPDPTGAASTSGSSLTMVDPTHRHVSVAADTGSGTPHTILSPIIAINYIIKV
jgi:hypothetical protein